MRTVIATAFIMALAIPAAAADESVAVRPDRPPALELSVKAGGYFPQLTSKLGTNFDGVLKVGYGVALDRRLQVFADLGYSQPSTTSGGTDPRLGASGASYTSTLTVRDLTTTIGADYFFRLLSSVWLPYAGAGLQLHFLRSTASGSAQGTPFGDTDETSTEIGATAFGGIGMHLGPGVLLGEVRFIYAPLSQNVTGSSALGAVSVLLGYGLFL